MGLFKKIKKGIKGVRKALHLPAITLGNVAKIGAVAGTGGLGAGAVALGTKVIKSRLKSIGVGGIKQVLRSKAEKAIANRIVKLSPSMGGASSKATAMPGGAPLRGGSVSSATPRPKRRRKRRAKMPARTATRPAAATKSKRKAPTGGKDFKALSASWRAAGKPGRWLDWIKSH